MKKVEVTIANISKHACAVAVSLVLVACGGGNADEVIEQSVSVPTPVVPPTTTSGNMSDENDDDDQADGSSNGEDDDNDEDDAGDEDDPDEGGTDENDTGDEDDEDDGDDEGNGEDEDEGDDDDEGGGEGEGNGNEEECSDPEEGCQLEITTGFVNPNPIPDMTVFPVDLESANRAARFLAQASLGANYPTVTQVASMGEAAWLESQFQQPVGRLMPYTDFLIQLIEQNADNDQFVEALDGPEYVYLNAWWTQVMTSPDLVRQKVAMALSEIFVASASVEAIGETPPAMAQYYDVLLDNAFGNYRDLLKGITLSPAMGVYLSHMGNQKANEAAGTFPDENYAREVMQLFSIGLFELNPDGSQKLDGNGNPIPTYDQQDIREFAKIFTGLSTNSQSGFVGANMFEGDYFGSSQPMIMYEQYHSTEQKRLLNGQIVPAGQTGMQDIDAAMDNLFNHPNVGPFIGKQLIQRLVTSNPSPAYIERVTRAFNGESSGVRGDMKAIIRAILLDPEATTQPSQQQNTAGRLREPFLRLLRLKRTFNATTVDRTHAGGNYDLSSAIRQYVMFSPSVFNFFQPNYRPNGEIKDAGLVAPEFQITNASSIVEVKNVVQLFLETGRIEERAGLLPSETVSFESELAIAQDVGELVSRLDTLMTYGTLTSNTREAVISAIQNLEDPLDRVRMAIYLIAISPDYAVAI